MVFSIIHLFGNYHQILHNSFDFHELACIIAQNEMIEVKG
jgi:hypothetical protein